MAQPDFGIPGLARFAGGGRSEAIRQWFKVQSIIGELKQFKYSEIDRPARYQELYKWLGAANSDVWAMKAASTVSKAVALHGSPIDAEADGTTDQDRLYLRLILITRRLIALAKVPGAGQFEVDSEKGLKWCYEAIMDLLLAVLYDLQDKPSGRFAKLLQGSTVPNWGTSSTAAASVHAEISQPAAPEKQTQVLPLAPLDQQVIEDGNSDRSRSPGLFVSPSRSPSPPPYRSGPSSADRARIAACKFARCSDRDCSGDAASHKASLEVKIPLAQAKELKDELVILLEYFTEEVKNNAQFAENRTMAELRQAGRNNAKRHRRTIMDLRKEVNDAKQEEETLRNMLKAVRAQNKTMERRIARLEAGL